MALLLVVIIAFAPGVLLVPLFYWTRWLARRTAAPRHVLRTAYTVLALGALAAVLAAIGGFSAVTAATDENDDASRRARALAEGISEAMNGGALVVAIALILALWLLLGTWRWHWAGRRKTKVPRDGKRL